MSSLKGRTPNLRTEYTVSYSYSGGVDLTGEHKSDGKRPVYIENLYRDYEGSGGDMLESIPGFRILTSLDGRINGIFKRKLSDYHELIIHHGGTVSVARLENGTISDVKRVTAVNDAPSRAFLAEGCIYLLDGLNIHEINAEGKCVKIGENGKNTYVPTTYYNGTPFEQRNILTDNFCEKAFAHLIDDFTMGSDGIYYRITDFENKKCAVCGTNDYFMANYASIPSYVTLGGEKFSVCAIDDNAFKPGTHIVELHIGEGVGTIGKSAFAGCTAIEKIYFPSTLAEIKDSAFAGCSSLTEIHLWLGFQKFGRNVFERCDNFKTIYYTGDADDFSEIENHNAVSDKTLVKSMGYYEIKLELFLSKEAKIIKNVIIGNVAYPFTSVTTGKGLVKSVIVDVYDKRRTNGTEIEIWGEYPEDASGIGAAIKKCTVFEAFDGRIFLSGSEDMKNTVFFSGIGKDGTPTARYFGEYDYWRDGDDGTKIVSLLGVHDGIAVFKEGDGAGGSIFYHTPASGDDFVHKSYPVSYIHSGLNVMGEAISFLDDPVFLTDGGLLGIESQRLDKARSVGCRSTLINPALLTERLSEIHLTRWRGYLVVAAGEHIYLADSRGAYVNAFGGKEYEWYYLSGIGTYRLGENVYRYSSVAKEGFTVHERVDERACGTVMSASVDGELYTYVEEGGILYPVYKTEERVGGEFYPLTAICKSGDGELIFGTECGDVCIFNTDKRGLLPDFIESEDGEKYGDVYDRKIHPYYYSFADRAPRYALKSAKDNCGISNALKNTVKHSFAFSIKTDGGSPLCEVGTDRRGYGEVCRVPNSEIDFSYFDFSALSFSTSDRITVPVSEREKSWIEKQVAISSSDFCSPIGIGEISYRFTVKGRIKKS